MSVREGDTRAAFGRIGTEAARRATGRGWDDWLSVLDDAGAQHLSHPEIVSLLEREHPEVESGWWRQTITVGYERARGLRVVGQTAAAGFELGVQRTVAADPDRVWALLVSRPDLWLGDGGEAQITPGGAVTGPDVSGEVRVVRPSVRLRLRWQPHDWARPASLQWTLSRTTSGGTRIGMHLEQMPDPEARERMRHHWSEVLGRIAAALA